MKNRISVHSLGPTTREFGNQNPLAIARTMVDENGALRAEHGGRPRVLDAGARLGTSAGRFAWPGDFATRRAMQQWHRRRAWFQQHTPRRPRRWRCDSWNGGCCSRPASNIISGPSRPLAHFRSTRERWVPCSGTCAVAGRCEKDPVSERVSASHSVKDSA